MAQQTKAAPATPVPVVPVSVSIAAISDQTTLAAATLDSTVSGGTGPYTYAWRVNAATTGIASATAADTTFTPTASGRMAVSLTVTDALGATGTASTSFLVGTAALAVSIAAVADQLGLAAIALDSTVTGGVTPYTYSWTVNGATTGLSSSTTADPTLTPTLAMTGLVTAACTVTDAAGVTQTATRTFQLGDDDRWVKVWSVDLAAEAEDLDGLGGGAATRTYEGVSFTVVNQVNVAASSGTDGVTGLVVKCTGTRRMWWDGSDGPGLAAKIQDIFTAAGAGTYDSSQHAIAWQASVADAVPTTAAVYGLVLANNLWSVAAAHFRTVVGENSSGNEKGTAGQCSDVNGAAVQMSPDPTVYPLGLAIVRDADTSWAVVDEVELGSPADYPTEFARGGVSHGSTISANVWTDATDYVGLCVTNNGVGTTTATFVGLVLWVRPAA